MFYIQSKQNMPILATFNPNKGIKITASAINQDLGNSFSKYIVEQKDPRFVYAIARAVTADVPNKNWDLFPLDEIKKAYHTFIGRNIFLDHNTKSVRNAVGKIVAAELREDDEGQIYVACLFKVDRQIHPDIAMKIEDGIIDSVSMGANVMEAECSICHQRATRESEFCFVPGTLVATKGFIYKPIEEVEVGDIVITHTGEEKPVLTKFVRTVDEPVYTIKSAFNNRSVTATGNHPFGVATPNGIVWKEAKDLQVKDWLFQPKYVVNNQADPNDNVEFAEWLGYYLSEGWTNHQGQTTGKPFNKLEFTVGIYEDEFINRLLTLGKKFLGVEGRVYPSYANSLGCSVRFQSPNVGNLLFEYGGHKAAHKCINSKVFGWSDESKLALLHGFLEGDGTITRGGRAVSFSTASYKLAYQFKKLFNDLGYPANVCEYINGGGPTNRNKTSIGYHVAMYGDNSESFLKKEGSALQFKHSNTPGFCFVWMNNYYFSIKDIEVNHYVGPVYNLEVADHNSYIAEGVVVHNCEHLHNLGRYQAFDQGTPNYSINHGVEFTELSLVSVPADPTAKMHKVFNQKSSLTKTADDRSEETKQQEPKVEPTQAANKADDFRVAEIPQSNVNVGIEPNVGKKILPANRETGYFQIDCASIESADLLYNILEGYIHRGIEELVIKGKTLKLLMSDTVTDAYKFIEEAVAVFGLEMAHGLVLPEKVAAYDTYLSVTAAQGKLHTTYVPVLNTDIQYSVSSSQDANKNLCKFYLPDYIFQSTTVIVDFIYMLFGTTGVSNPRINHDADTKQYGVTFTLSQEAKKALSLDKGKDIATYINKTLANLEDGLHFIEDEDVGLQFISNPKNSKEVDQDYNDTTTVKTETSNKPEKPASQEEPVRKNVTEQKVEEVTKPNTTSEEVANQEQIGQTNTIVGIEKSLAERIKSIKKPASEKQLDPTKDKEILDIFAQYAKNPQGNWPYFVKTAYNIYFGLGSTENSTELSNAIDTFIETIQQGKVDAKADGAAYNYPPLTAIPESVLKAMLAKAQGVKSPLYSQFLEGESSDTKSKVTNLVAWYIKDLFGTKGKAANLAEQIQKTLNIEEPNKGEEASVPETPKQEEGVSPKSDKSTEQETPQAVEPTQEETPTPTVEHLNEKNTPQQQVEQKQQQVEPTQPSVEPEKEEQINQTEEPKPVNSEKVTTGVNFGNLSVVVQALSSSFDHNNKPSADTIANMFVRLLNEKEQLLLKQFSEVAPGEQRELLHKLKDAFNSLTNDREYNDAVYTHIQSKLESINSKTKQKETDAVNEKENKKDNKPNTETTSTKQTKSTGVYTTFDTGSWRYVVTDVAAEMEEDSKGEPYAVPGAATIMKAMGRPEDFPANAISISCVFNATNTNDDPDILQGTFAIKVTKTAPEAYEFSVSGEGLSSEANTSGKATNISAVIQKALACLFINRGMKPIIRFTDGKTEGAKDFSANITLAYIDREFSQTIGTLHITKENKNTYTFDITPTVPVLSGLAETNETVTVEDNENFKEKFNTICNTWASKAKQVLLADAGYYQS